MREINISEYSTFYRIPILEGVDYSSFTKDLSTTDYYTQKLNPYGYKKTKSFICCMKIPKGILVKNLVKCGLKCNIKREADFPILKARPFKMINPPKSEIQSEVIDSIYKNFLESDDNTRAVISLNTGLGKTYVATNLIHKLGVKTIVMVKTNTLKEQWAKSFNTHTDCRNVLPINTGADLVELLEINDKSKLPDIFICTHRLMSAFINEHGAKTFARLMLNLGIGMKVFDEFDLENANMFNMDMSSSVRYNLYLSATTYKSSSSENHIFKRIFLSAYDIGSNYQVNTKRNGVFILYKSNPTKAEFGRCFQYTPNGPEFSYTKFHEYVVLKKAFIPKLEELWRDFIKKRYDNKLKTVFFIGRKTTAKSFAKILSEITGVPLDKIGIFNSDVSIEDRRIARDKLLIVSTSVSMGRGVDLEGLDTVVDFETRASMSTTSQVIGRVSRTGMKTVGTYIQFVDVSFPVVKRNYSIKMKRNAFEQFFTDIKVKSDGEVYY